MRTIWIACLAYCGLMLVPQVNATIAMVETIVFFIATSPIAALATALGDGLNLNFNILPLLLLICLSSFVIASLWIAMQGKAAAEARHAGLQVVGMWALVSGATIYGHHVLKTTWLAI